MPRSESYRKIVEAAEDAILTDNRTGPVETSDPDLLFQHFRPAAKFASIERVHRARSVRMLVKIVVTPCKTPHFDFSYCSFEFFNVKRSERRIYERYPENSLSVATGFSSDDTDSGKSSPKGFKVIFPKLLHTFLI